MLEHAKADTGAAEDLLVAPLGNVGDGGQPMAGTGMMSLLWRGGVAADACVTCMRHGVNVTAAGMPLGEPAFVDTVSTNAAAYKLQKRSEEVQAIVDALEIMKLSCHTAPACPGHHTRMSQFMRTVPYAPLELHAHIRMPLIR